MCPQDQVFGIALIACSMSLKRSMKCTTPESGANFLPISLGVGPEPLNLAEVVLRSRARF